MHRPCVPLVLALALSCPAADLRAAQPAASELRRVQSVSLEQLLATPLSYQSVPVQFEAIWLGITDLFDSQRSHFHPERYLNCAVWSARARLWDPVERSQPLVTLFISKDLPGADHVAQLRRYQPVRVTGRVAAIIDGLPWIEVRAISPLPHNTQYSDSALTHISQGIALAAENAVELADEHFAAALAEALPTHARILVGELRARALAHAERWSEVAAVLEPILPLADADAALAPATRAGLHALQARALQASAGEDRARHELAIAAAERALAIDPAQSEAYAVLGISLAAVGRLDEARRHCERAQRLRPDDAQVRLTLGRILDAQGRHEAAIEVLRRAIDLAPKDPQIHLAIARAYLNRGRAAGELQDFLLALRECEIALRLDARLAAAHLVNARVLELAAERGLALPLPEGRVVPTRQHIKERYELALRLDAALAEARRALQAIVDQEQAEARAKAEAEERARREAEERARREAEERARLEAEERARREAEERARREAEERARLEAEERARQEAEPQAPPQPDATAPPGSAEAAPGNLGEAAAAPEAVAPTPSPAAPSGAPPASELQPKP
ncbi:MAG: tetratricopeptide repeat protein [Planctomycetota bacterium]|nr:tetratricopeptide repeat protein [Planctomycetota bacterium]